MNDQYFEKRYCFQCLIVHWLEVTPANREVCHGEDFNPLTITTTHYARRSGKGYTMHEKISTRKPVQQMPLEWQIRQDAEL